MKQFMMCEGNGFPLHTIFLRDHTHFRQCLHFWSPIKITRKFETPLKHYNFSQKHFQTLFRTKFCIRPYLDLHTAKTIATSIVHSKLDYCNSLYYGLPKFQMNRLQHIQNALVRTIVQAPKLKHITPILKSFHWLKVSERIEYKIISLTKFSIPLSLRIYMTLYIFSLLTVTTHAFHLMSLSSNHHHHSKSLIEFRHASRTSSLEPAPYITQNSSSELFIPLSASSATFIWTCRFNLLHSAITFHHFLTVSLWA